MHIILGFAQVVSNREGNSAVNKQLIVDLSTIDFGQVVQGLGRLNEISGPSPVPGEFIQLRDIRYAEDFTPFFMFFVNREQLWLIIPCSKILRGL